MQPWVTGTHSNKVKRQKGFTLIELMVVVVIMAIVASVGVMSLGGQTQTQLESEERRFMAAFSWVQDQSTLRQKLFLLAPNEEGLRAYYLSQGKWQEAKQFRAVSWPVGWQVDWNGEQNGEQLQPKAPANGWLIWPSGDVSPGEVTWLAEFERDWQKGTQEEEHQRVLSWNGLLSFQSQRESDE